VLVVRALPAAAEASYPQLAADLDTGLERLHRPRRHSEHATASVR
jgi:RNase P protein component